MTDVPVWWRQQGAPDRARANDVDSPSLHTFANGQAASVAAVEFFSDAWVSVSKNAAGRRFIQMRLRSGLQTFYCDIHESQRGLRRCQQVAQRLGLTLFVTDEALQAMQARE